MAYGVIEISGSQSLLYRRNVIRVRIALYDDLHSFTKTCQLISNITRSAERFELQELFVAELLRVVRVCPLVPYIQERKVVTARSNKILTGLVRMQFLVFGSVEDG